MDRVEKYVLTYDNKTYEGHIYDVWKIYGKLVVDFEYGDYYAFPNGACGDKDSCFDTEEEALKECEKRNQEELNRIGIKTEVKDNG